MNMSPSFVSRNAGFSALLAISGERLKRGEVELRALVNRAVIKGKDAVASRDGSLDFTSSGVTEIQFKRDLTEPAVGESLVDDLGWSHRIRKVGQTDISWIVYCTTSKAS